jgi:putative membrane protein insertion efficiency factor
MSPLGYLLLGVVRLYQWCIRPILGPNCRFVPSCSEYAVDALQQHGAICGSTLAFRRILRCNPWHEGGFDPVPPTCSCRVKGPEAL